MESYSASSRHPASSAMIELRKAIGKTQTGFAVEVLRMAVSTVARYETSQPPSGDLLLRLSEIATENRLYHLHDLFKEQYVQEVFAKLGFNLLTVPETETTPLHGYLLMKLEGPKQIALAQKLLRDVHGEPDDGMMAQIQKTVLGTASRKKPK